MPTDAVTTKSVSPTRIGGCNDVRIRSAERDSFVDVGDVFTEHEELVAAGARHGVLVSSSLAEPPRNLDEHLVADGVTARVVDVLEVVDVEEQDRCRTPRPHHQMAGEAVREQSPVRQTGQAVVQRDAAQLGLVALAVGDVRHHVEDLERVGRSVARVDEGRGAHQHPTFRPVGAQQHRLVPPDLASRGHAVVRRHDRALIGLDEVEQRCGFQPCDLGAEDLSHVWVREDGAPGRVRDPDAFLGGVEDRSVPRLAPRERVDRDLQIGDLAHD